MRYIIALITFLGLCMSAQGQVITDFPVDSSVIKEFEKRVKLTRIEGKYIPIDLNDAIAELNKIMEDGAKKKFKEMSEDNARRKTHFSFGKYINARWHIQDGSRLTLWFQSNKIYNTDDMIDCIIATYHRSLNNQPLQFEQLAEYYFKKQKEKVDKLVKKKAEQSKSRQK